MRGVSVGCNGMRGVAAGCNEMQRAAEGCSAARRDTKGCSGIRGMQTVAKGLQGVSVGCKGLRRDAGSCKRLRRIAVKCRVTRGVAVGRKRLQWDTRGCKRLRRDAGMLPTTVLGVWSLCLLPAHFSPTFSTTAPCSAMPVRGWCRAGTAVPAVDTQLHGASSERSAAGICSRTFRAERSERPSPGAPLLRETTGTSGEESSATSYCTWKGGGGEKNPNSPNAASPRP